MACRDNNTILDLYNRLTSNEEFVADFLYCVQVGGCGELAEEKSTHVAVIT